MPKSITVAVAGATGKQRGAVARMLLHRGHQVRAMTKPTLRGVSFGVRFLNDKAPRCLPVAPATATVMDFGMPAPGRLL